MKGEKKKLLKNENNKRTRRQKIKVDIVFKFLKINANWEARSQKRVPKVRSARENTLSI